MINLYNENIVNDLLIIYDKMINKYCSILYGSSSNLIKEFAISQFKNNIINGIEILKKKEYNEKYILRYCGRIIKNWYISESDDVIKYREYVCPICSSYLENEGSYLKCIKCNLNNVTKHFILHSRQGVECLECKRFLPISMAINGRISCPYENCLYFGYLSELNKKIHPVKNKIVSFIETDDNISLIIPSPIIFNSIYKFIKKKVSKNVRDLQVIKSVAMLDAFRFYFDFSPKETIEFILNKDNSKANKISSKIIQKYSKIIEDQFPIVFTENKVLYNIDDLCHPKLTLFNKLIKTELLLTNNKIKNENLNNEHYISKNFKTYNNYLIGRIINSNIKINDYSFSEITFDNIGKLNIEYYSLIPHFNFGVFSLLKKIKSLIKECLEKNI